MADWTILSNHNLYYSTKASVLAIIWSSIIAIVGIVVGVWIKKT